jgi:hypothetical protein
MPCHPRHFTPAFQVLPGTASALLRALAGQGAVVRRQAACGIAADNLLTGRTPCRANPRRAMKLQALGPTACTGAAQGNVWSTVTCLEPCLCRGHQGRVGIGLARSGPAGHHRGRRHAAGRPHALPARADAGRLGPWVPSQRGPGSLRAHRCQGRAHPGGGRRAADRQSIPSRCQASVDEPQRASRCPSTGCPPGRRPAGGRMLRRRPVNRQPTRGPRPHRHHDGEDRPSGPKGADVHPTQVTACLLYTTPIPRDTERSRMPSSA